MAYAADDDGNSVFLFASIYGGVALALLFAFVFPRTPTPPPPRSDAIGCYGAPGWPQVEVTEQHFIAPGAGRLGWKTRWFKTGNGIEVAPGFNAIPDDNGGSFRPGHTGFLDRLARNSEGRLRPSRETGPIGYLAVGGIIFERVPCAA